MILKDIRDYLKELNTLESFGLDNFYIGTLDNKKENSVLVRTFKYGSVDDNFSIGQLRSYKTFEVSLLLHISKDYTTTEEISNKVFNYFLNNGSKSFNINEHNVYFIKLLSKNEDVGRDPKSDIFERVIEFQIYYN
jgi:hypothetical protein